MLALTALTLVVTWPCGGWVTGYGTCDLGWPLPCHAPHHCPYQSCFLVDSRLLVQHLPQLLVRPAPPSGPVPHHRPFICSCGNKQAKIITQLSCKDPLKLCRYFELHIAANLESLQTTMQSTWHLQHSSVYAGTDVEHRGTIDSRL